MEFATRAIHIGNDPDPQTGAVMPPIYMTSTFALDAPGQSKGFEYTRASNPNFVFLEKQLASLEQGAHATVFSSGIGALTALVATLRTGDKVLTIDGIYGGTYRLFTQILSHFGVEMVSVLPASIEDVDQALAHHKPKWILFESPTNPLMNIYDIQSIAQCGKKHGALIVVDNTFASPYCQNPLTLGVDVVWHSTTKYISGHSDVLGGVVITNDPDFKKQMDFNRKTLGTNPSPFDAWLISRGAKTLAVRMQQHEKNALAVAQFLEKHPKVKQVYYPGLPSHPGHAIAKKQMRSFNGMLSADIDLPQDSLIKLLSSFKYFTLAESLGGVESLISHPPSMTHSIVPKSERDELGLHDNLVRFSVGIEDTQDLLEDLENTLAKFS